MSAAPAERRVRASPQAWQLRNAEVASVWVPGLYAWSATVAVPCFQAQERASARWAAGVALVCLAVGPVAVFVWGRVAATSALVGFVGSCSVSWALLGSSLTSGAAPSAPQALGVVAWGAFSLGWGRFVHVALGPPSSGRLTPTLAARGEVPLLPRLGFGALVVCALGFLLLAWRSPPAGALLVHGCALVSAVSLVSVSAHVLFASPGSQSHRVRLPRILWVAWVALGGVLWWLR